MELIVALILIELSKAIIQLIWMIAYTKKEGK